jgi:hypothetical protein
LPLVASTTAAAAAAAAALPLPERADFLCDAGRCTSASPAAAAAAADGNTGVGPGVGGTPDSADMLSVCACRHRRIEHNPVRKNSSHTDGPPSDAVTQPISPSSDPRAAASDSSRARASAGVANSGPSDLRSFSLERTSERRVHAGQKGCRAIGAASFKRLCTFEKARAIKAHTSSQAHTLCIRATHLSCMMGALERRRCERRQGGTSNQCSPDAARAYDGQPTPFVAPHSL